jgi:leucyl/phenylalanyl-tRNA--protein transferase
MFASRNTGQPEPFPSPSEATREGLVAIGGDLTPERLVLAYRSGIFPWFEEGLPVLWWSPDPRAVLELDHLHVPRRLERTCKGAHYRITINQEFDGVIRGCAAGRPEGTWITDSMRAAYRALHRIGYAHSVEAWHGDRLAGGVYGVAIGGFFAGESMFYRRRDASKVALVHLVRRLRRRGFVLFDLQILNDHTAQFGASTIPREEYLARLKQAVELPVQFQGTAL